MRAESDLPLLLQFAVAGGDNAPLAAEVLGDRRAPHTAADDVAFTDFRTRHRETGIEIRYVLGGIK